jgi:hypothetical protein
VDPSDPSPPPTPFEREGAVTSASSRARRRRVTRVVAAVLLVGAVAAGGWLALRDGGPTAQRPGGADQDRDAALLTLFVEIEQSERAMLDYYDRLREELDDPRLSREQVLEIIGDAAAEAVERLRETRSRIVPLAGDALVDDVRAAYLPHLDSWVDYLDAVVEEPGLETDRELATPFTLVINATARAFRVATEEMLATDPSEEVRSLAETILDEGFRGFDDEAQT